MTNGNKVNVMSNQSCLQSTLCLHLNEYLELVSHHQDYFANQIKALAQLPIDRLFDAYLSVRRLSTCA